MMGSQKAYSTHIFSSLFSTIIILVCGIPEHRGNRSNSHSPIAQSDIKQKTDHIFEQLFSSVSEMLLPLHVVLFPHGHTYKRFLHFLQCPLQWALVSVHSCVFQICIYQNHQEGWLNTGWISNSIGLGLGSSLSICMCNMSQEMLMLLVQGLHFENHWAIN